MTPAEARQLGAQKLHARRRKTTLIRQRVVAIAVALFLALWAIVFAQLVAGHDPALASSKSAATTTATATSTPASSDNTTTSAATTSSTDNSGTSSSNNSGTASAVTTRQS